MNATTPTIDQASEHRRAALSLDLGRLLRAQERLARIIHAIQAAEPSRSLGKRMVVLASGIERACDAAGLDALTPEWRARAEATRRRLMAQAGGSVD